MPRLTRTSLRGFTAVAAPLVLIAGLLAADPAAAAPVGATASSLTAAGAPPGAPPVPRLTWTDCDDGFQCATAKVPLDHAKPRGRAISLALIRLPATDRRHRIGSLFVNPGGPGGSGVDFVRFARELYSASVRARFDIVGFDPRFIGGSRPLATCASDQEYLGLYQDLPVFPITRAQEQRAHRANQQYTALCARRSPFLAYASTANVARDLDLLRAAVGDRKLSYVGYSYGCILGQTYAALFPGKVRALTIDGVIDAQKWSTGSRRQSRRVPFTTRIGSALGASATFGQFTKLCDQAGPDACAFTADGDAAAKFERLANRLKTHPYQLPDDGPLLDYARLVDATLGVLYGPLDWQAFAVELQDVYAAVFATDVRTTAAGPADAGAKALIQRAAAAPRWGLPGYRSTPAADLPIDSGFAAFLAVSCSDSINPRSVRAWAVAGATQDRVAPYFGRDWTWAGEPCASWSLPSPGRYLGPYTRATSSPVLVIGNTYDPATPYSGARAAAAAIPQARLLTINGYGHTALAAPSACATAAFDAYTINGRLPVRGAVCGQDVAPFSQPLSP
jgi:pimeloyl-ACP methyl ester carboxylesterase